MLNPEEPRRRGGRPRLWLVTVLLILPATIPYLCQYAPRNDGEIPTGLVQFDFPIYLAKGREHVDPGAFQFTYSQPCSDRYDEPRIYAQPWTIALGLAYRYSGLNPGQIYTGFFVVAALFCTGAAVALYKTLVGLDTWSRRLGLVLFFWGGGVLALSGIAYALAARLPGFYRRNNIFRFEPGEGWWFLNFGRNLVFPTEALYHGLFLLTILLAARRRWAWATLLATLTAANSPFAGAGLLAVLWAWGLVEVAFLENRSRMAGFFAAVNGLLVGFVAYYFVFLGRFPEHRLVVSQMEFEVEYRAAAFVPALLLVGALAAWTLRNARVAGERLASPTSRLLLVWFGVTFILSHHEFLIHPRQPIHFDRGYAYTALFFLGAPALIALLEGIARRLPRLLAAPALAAVAFVFLSDNLIWFARFPYDAIQRIPDGSLRVTPDQLGVLRALDDPKYYGDLLISGDEAISNLAIAYTPLRSWCSHEYETPHYKQRLEELRQFSRSGRAVASWEGRPLLVAVAARPTADEQHPVLAWIAGHHGSIVYENSGYQVYRIEPRPPG